MTQVLTLFGDSVESRQGRTFKVIRFRHLNKLKYRALVCPETGNCYMPREIESNELAAELRSIAGLGPRFGARGGMHDPTPAPEVESTEAQEETAQREREEEALKEAALRVGEMIRTIAFLALVFCICRWALTRG